MLSANPSFGCLQTITLTLFKFSLTEKLFLSLKVESFTLNITTFFLSSCTLLLRGKLFGIHFLLNLLCSTFWSLILSSSIKCRLKNGVSAMSSAVLGNKTENFFETLDLEKNYALHIRTFIARKFGEVKGQPFYQRNTKQFKFEKKASNPLFFFNKSQKLCFGHLSKICDFFVGSAKKWRQSELTLAFFTL